MNDQNLFAMLVVSPRFEQFRSIAATDDFPTKDNKNFTAGSITKIESILYVYIYERNVQRKNQSSILISGRENHVFFNHVSAFYSLTDRPKDKIFIK